MSRLKASELRIGNVVESYIGEEGLEWEPNVIDVQDIERCDELPDEFNKEHRAAQLTEEWLRKFGFTKHTTDNLVYYEYAKLTICNWDNSGFVMSNAFSFDLRVNLISVHQLQNLYFSLTGEELKLQSETTIS